MKPIIDLNKKILAWEALFFPQQAIYNNNISAKKQIFLFVGLMALFTGLGFLLPADGYYGFDWVHFFGVGNMPLYYPPWVVLIQYLSWPVFVGLSLSGVASAILQRSKNHWSTGLAFLTLPMFWTIFIGQVDALVVLGLAGLSWFALGMAPLALLKPQVSMFAFLAKKQYLFAALLTFLVSFLIWGFWPTRLIGAMSFYTENGYTNNIALKWYGIPLSLVLLWFSRGDMDMLMAAGAFGTLHLIPFNLLPLTPAIARLDPPLALVACFLSWLPLSANWLGPAGWWLAWLFVAWLWGCLAWQRYDLSGQFSQIKKRRHAAIYSDPDVESR